VLIGYFDYQLAQVVASVIDLRDEPVKLDPVLTTSFCGPNAGNPAIISASKPERMAGYKGGRLAGAGRGFITPETILPWIAVRLRRPPFIN
jgi:hypothetical protein